MARAIVGAALLTPRARFPGQNRPQRPFPAPPYQPQAVFMVSSMHGACHGAWMGVARAWQPSFTGQLLQQLPEQLLEKRAMKLPSRSTTHPGLVSASPGGSLLIGFPYATAAAAAVSALPSRSGPHACGALGAIARVLLDTDKVHRLAIFRLGHGLLDLAGHEGYRIYQQSHHLECCTGQTRALWGKPSVLSSRCHRS